MTDCPVCEATIESRTWVLGEIVPCPDCGTELEISGTAPVTVQLAPKEAEDWGE